MTSIDGIGFSAQLGVAFSKQSESPPNFFPRWGHCSNQPAFQVGIVLFLGESHRGFNSQVMGGWWKIFTQRGQRKLQKEGFFSELTSTCFEGCMGPAWI